MRKKIFSLLALVMTVMTASAIDAPSYNLTVGENAQGSVKFYVAETEVTKAPEGATVTVKITPNTGWVVNKPSGQWYAAVVRAPRHRASIDLLSDVELTAVTGKENTWTFTMARANVEISATYKKLLTHEDIGISGIKDLTYNGQAQTPAVTVTDGEYTLVPGTDYTISYSDNTNAGEATATLKGTGDNYAGEWVMNFTIQKAALTVKAEDKSVTFGDDAPTYTETYDGFVNNETKAVLSGTLAFACSYVKNQTAAGTYDITPSGYTSNNYDITFTKGTLTVGKKALESSMIANIASLVYNGVAQEPAPVVTFNGMTLVKGTDYTVSYADNVNVGTATATVTALANSKKYSGSASKTFSITKKALTVKAEDKSVTFGDDAPQYTVSYDGFVNNETKAVLSGTLAFACDYVKNQTAAGTYDITPSGYTSNNYDITFTKGTLTVGKKALESSMIANIASLVYNGVAQEPAPVVTFNGMTLVKGTDYTVSYADNVNPGTATVTVTAVASSKKYAGTATKTFTIQKKEVTADMIAGISPLTYTGKAHKPAPVVTYNGMTLKEGTDYIVFYTNNVNAGIATVTIQGIGYYSGTASKLFLIIPKLLEDGMIAAIAPVIYTGTQQKPAPVVTYNGMTLVEGIDYTVSYTDNVEAGTATVTITAVVGGNYSGTASTTFTIQKKSMFDDMIVTINPVTYTGQALTPDISVTYNGMNLVLGRDYTVSYSDNVNAGYATVTIQGYGNYRGTASKQFYIAPKLLSELMVSDIDNQVYTGEALTPAPVITYNGMTLVEGTDYTVSYIDNVDTGTATVTVTAVANGNYRGTVTTSFTIVADKTELNSVITDADAFYGSIKDNYADIAATLLEAIDEAKGVQGDENASQQAVNDAVDALKGAIQAAKDAIATGIAAIQMDAKSVWYDLNGRKLQGKPTRKGLYIVNGRTVVVK